MKAKTAIATDNAPGATGSYSQPVMTGNLHFTSAQLPIDPATGIMVEGSIADRAHQTLKKLAAAVVKAAGATLENVAKTTGFLFNIGDLQEFNTVYVEYFASPFPARNAF
ncbi:Rid family hydrolase [Desulfogranum marinum]|uniref:Rid family hydrolase n=1 Tax=Desulfogranum marinum TaxID=453220 RepID=UPI00196255B0|nr:Rid family hydrolase [Desulfogranum marinum]MBM9514021.1 RidA family protein [Desulfogranum marinum]